MAIMGLLGSAANLLTDYYKDERQMGYQRELMGVQKANQSYLNAQGQKLQMKTWRETNYPAQMEQMKKAGLNPSLMYGLGGGGGTTAGSQGGGSAQSGQAPQKAPTMGMVEALMAEAQIKNINAQTKKAEAEANKIKGIDTREGESRIMMNAGIISLNLTQEELNESARALNLEKGKLIQEQTKLQGALKQLTEAQTGQALANTTVTQATIEWMKRTGLNPNDGVMARTIQYLSRTSGLSEQHTLYLLGGAIGLRELIKLIPPRVLEQIGQKGRVVVGGLGKK